MSTDRNRSMSTRFLRGPAIEAFTPPAHVADTEVADTHAAATRAGDTYAADTRAATPTQRTRTQPSLTPRPRTQPQTAAAVAPPVDGGEAVLRAALSAASREVIEKIAWEVVPQLAEVILREHVERLIKSREGRG